MARAQPSASDSACGFDLRRAASPIDPVAWHAYDSEMDFGSSAADYAAHREGFPDSFFERLPLTGRVLDLGSGTGTLARGYTERGASTVALDVSRAMLRE